MRASLGLLLGFAVVASVPAPPANGCAIPWRGNQSVQVDSEDALIIWDEASKTEHFIRRANFKTDANDFGFLVPTPSQPELAEASDSIFAALVDATKPRVIYQTIHRPGAHAPSMKTAARAAPDVSVTTGAVQVLEHKKVAGFEAAVLKANDPKALREWLEKNGYDARKELIEWFQWYTEHNWIITAFKISKDGSPTNSIQGRTVRMTLKTEQPFYPYREPADMRTNAPKTGHRLLKVFFVSHQQFEGRLGHDGLWPGQAVWANTMPPTLASTVFTNIGLDPLLAKAESDKSWYLTEFEDRSHPRPGTDEVYFQPKANATTIERPPIIVPVYVDEEPIPASSKLAENYAVPVLVGVGLIVVGVIGFLAWLLMRK